MRRLVMAAAVLVAAALMPSAAVAQSAEGTVPVVVAAATPAWLIAAEEPGAEQRTPAPEALVAVRAADRHTGVTLMIVGLAGVLTGLIVDESAITVAGAVVGGVGLFMYLH